MCDLLTHLPAFLSQLPDPFTILALAFGIGALAEIT